jgi:uncharacterized membrane protein
MSSPTPNPYELPGHSGNESPSFGVPGTRVDAGRGVSWIAEGWALFKAAPVMWIVALLILLSIQMALGMIPILGSLASMILGPVLMAGLFAFAHGIRQGEAADISRLFMGFKEKFGALAILGVLYLLMMLGLIVATAFALFVVLGGTALLSAGDAQQTLQALMVSSGFLSALLVFLVAFLFMLLLAAAYWYAPALVFFTDISAGDALKQSFMACMRNWLPFLVYGILTFLVALLGTLALVIGLLVAIPVLLAANYASFRDIFSQPH